MDDQVFQLIQTQHAEVMGRFDRLEAAHAEHLTEDRAVHKIVERHAMYINIAFLGLPVLGGVILKKLGFINE
jgi:hypothetical protein